MNLKKIILTFVIASMFSVCTHQSAEADGPLRRWWRNLTNRNNARLTTPARTAFSPAVAANPQNLQPGQCMRTCQRTCRRTVVNYVPQTAYRTCYKRVPVTRYRPVANTDPCTGCTVTCMRPCTTFTYQTQRVPYTTYRPVYRTETFRVPVTTITNDCATGTCGTCPSPTGTSANFSPVAGCNTCGVSGGSGTTAQNFSPIGAATPTPATSTQTFTVDPATGLSTQGGFNSSPADRVPTLNSVPNPQTIQPPQFNPGPVSPGSGTTVTPGSTTRNFSPSTRSLHEQLHRPKILQQSPASQTAKASIRQNWDYSPVRFASSSQPNERRLTATAVRRPTPTIRKSRWVEVD